MLTGNSVDTFFRDMYDCFNFIDDRKYKSINKTKEKWDISDFRSVYESYYELSENKLDVNYPLGKMFTITPFSSFSERTPSWWSAYNKVKHEYYDSFYKANLKNVLNCLGALLILNALHLCSIRYLALQGIVKSYDYDFDQNFTIDRSIDQLLLQSKIGHSYFGFPLSINTKLFDFTYREEQNVI